MCIVLKSVQLYTPIATCMYQMCHIPRQDVIESDRIELKKCVCVWKGAMLLKVVDNNAFLM